MPLSIHLKYIEDMVHERENAVFLNPIYFRVSDKLGVPRE